MKKVSFILLSTLTLSTLAACGANQINENNTENNVGGADEVEENLDVLNENNEENNQEEMNEEENSEEADEETEENIDNSANEENENHNEEENSNENTDAPEEDNADEEEAAEENADINDSDNDNEENSNHEADNEENETEEAADVSPMYLYFADAELMNTYRVASENDVSDNEAGAMEAMELWAAGPTSDELYSLLPEDTFVQYVELDDDEATVSLSPEIENANLGSSGEGMLVEQIAMMMEQFDASSTYILIDGSTEASFLGHVDLEGPVQAGSPEDYDIFE